MSADQMRSQPLCSGVGVLANDARMPCRDPEQRDSRPVRLDPVLLPIAERVDADSEGRGELFLRKADEATKRGDIARFQASRDDSLPLRSCYSSI